MNPCENLFGAILLTVDNELLEPHIKEELASHCEQCPPCESTLLAHQENVKILKSLLGPACQEVISDSLHERLIAQTQALAVQMQAGFSAQFTTQFTGEIYSETFTQTTVTIDGQTTIEISHTQEFREGF